MNDNYIKDLEKQLREIKKTTKTLEKIKRGAEEQMGNIVENLPEHMKKDFETLINFAKEGNVNAITNLQKELLEKYNDKNKE